MCVFEFKAGYFVLFFSKVVSDSELDSPEFAAVNDKSSTRLFFFFLVVLKMKSVVGVGSNDKRPNHFG